MKSALRASSNPPVTAGPFTAAITGTREAATAAMNGGRSVSWSVPRERRFSPAQNAGSVPVITMTAASWQSVTASQTAAADSTSIALRTSGRSRTISATSPSRRTATGGPEAVMRLSRFAARHPTARRSSPATPFPPASLRPSLVNPRIMSLDTRAHRRALTPTVGLGHVVIWSSGGAARVAGDRAGGRAGRAEPGRLRARRGEGVRQRHPGRHGRRGRGFPQHLPALLPHQGPGDPGGAEGVRGTHGGRAAGPAPRGGRLVGPAQRHRGLRCPDLHAEPGRRAGPQPPPPFPPGPFRRPPGHRGLAGAADAGAGRAARPRRADSDWP